MNYSPRTSHYSRILLDTVFNDFVNHLPSSLHGKIRGIIPYEIAHMKNYTSQINYTDLLSDP